MSSGACFVLIVISMLSIYVSCLKHTNILRTGRRMTSFSTYPNFRFDIEHQSTNSKARLGKITTPHGVVETPNFIFCATKAAMKAITTKQLREEQAQICLSNTYHLMLSPGADLVEQMGGLQKMTGWNGPMLTDSGGYQIFSMGHGSVSSEIKGRRGTGKADWNSSLLKVDENGAVFRSFIDGSIQELTPEISMEVQRKLGADLVVVLDECTPFNVNKKYTEDSMYRSHRWAIRCLNEFIRTSNGKQALYGIVQGGVYQDLRKVSAEFVNERPFFGMAIGGCLGGTKKEMHEIVRFTRELMRDDRPVHLLGIGGVRDIFHGVRQGIDTFDCVHPTRLGRHGSALVMASHWDEEPFDSKELPPHVAHEINRLGKAIRRERDRRVTFNQAMKVQMRADPSGTSEQIEKLKRQLKHSLDREAQLYKDIAKLRTQGAKAMHPHPIVKEHASLMQSSMRFDTRPIDSTCQCYTCKNFSRAYLFHLLKADESLGGTLVTLHNVHFMNRLMRDIRQGIQDGNLDEVEKKYVHPKLATLDEESVSAPVNS